MWQKVDLEKSVSEFVLGFGIQTLRRQRATALTHPNGVQLHGFVEMNLKIPPKSDENTGSSILARQSFFTAGTKYPVMVRFSNFGSCVDDRELCIRGAAVKFSEHPVSKL